MPIVSHSSVRRARVSSDREPWNEEREKGIAFSVPGPELELPDAVKEPSDLSLLGVGPEVVEGLENMSISVLCRLSVFVVFISGLLSTFVFAFVSTATRVLRELDAFDASSWSFAAVCALDKEGVSTSSRYTTRVSSDITRDVLSTIEVGEQIGRAHV